VKKHYHPIGDAIYPSLSYTVDCVQRYFLYRSVI